VIARDRPQGASEQHTGRMHGNRQGTLRRARGEGGEVRRLVDVVPDDASYEDIQYHIYVRQKVERGLEEVAQGKVASQEEVERWMAKWLEA